MIIIIHIFHVPENSPVTLLAIVSKVLPFVAGNADITKSY